MNEKGWHATVVGVEDNGIVYVISGDVKDKVGLVNIYLPDASDPQFAKARKYLKDKMLGKKIVLIPVLIEGSTFMCQIYLESICINQDILEEGLAWYYPKHGNYETWLDAFQKARIERKGIWSFNEDEIKTPLELRKEYTSKESFDKLYTYGAKLMPFVIYHNPYKYSSPSTGYKSQHRSVDMSAAEKADQYKDSYMKNGRTTDLLNYRIEYEKAMGYSK